MSFHESTKLLDQALWRAQGIDITRPLVVVAPHADPKPRCGHCRGRSTAYESDERVPGQWQWMCLMCGWRSWPRMRPPEVQR